jgi:hypothetical protein
VGSVRNFELMIKVAGRLERESDCCRFEWESQLVPSQEKSYSATIPKHDWLFLSFAELTSPSSRSIASKASITYLEDIGRMIELFHYLLVSKLNK